MSVVITIGKIKNCIYRNRAWLSAIVISCLSFLIYSNTFHNSFHFDDESSIVKNVYIRDLSNLSAIWSFGPTHFITHLTFALNYHFHQLRVFGYHLFNLLVHLGAGLLVWWLSRLTFSTPALKDQQISQHKDHLALLAALVFVAHPLQTQAVTYIIQRAASLATFFYLACLCLYAKARLSSYLFYYIFSLAMAVLAMFSKEISVTLPAMVVLYEFSFLRAKKGKGGKYVFPYLLLLPIVPVTRLMTRPVILTASGVQMLDLAPITSSWQYLLTEFKVMVTYLRLLFLPFNQNLDYDYPLAKSLIELPVLASLTLLVFILIIAVKTFRRHRFFSFCIFWFFLTLLPESSIIPIADVIFEHRLYLPMAGFSLFLVSATYYLFSRYTLKPMMVILLFMIAIYSFLTYQRNFIWKDDLTLWNDTVRKSPHKARPYNNRGLAYQIKGNLARALIDFNQALEINPQQAEAYCGRGSIYKGKGKINQVIPDYNKAIEIDPYFTEAYNNRGVIYAAQGNFKQALSDFDKAIELYPEYAKAYNNRGLLYKEGGRLDQALSDFNKAIELYPEYAKAYTNRSLVYRNKGNLDQALADLNQAIAINPHSAEFYYNRGLVYKDKGNFDQALADYSQAIKIYPQFSEAYNNRGIVYAAQGNFKQALSDYNQAIAINPQHAKAYYNRGLIFQTNGDLDQALADCNKAIQINPKYTEAYNTRGSLYVYKNDLTAAIADFTMVVEINPNYAKAYNNRGVAYFFKKEYNKSWLDIHKAEELGYKVNAEFLERLKQEIGDVSLSNYP